MATIKLNKKYRCSDDCVQSGCPSHIAELEFMSVSNGYKFTGRREHYFERGELEAFIGLLKELSELRADSVKLN